MFKFKKFLALTILTGALVSSVGFNKVYADDDGVEELAAVVTVVAEAPQAARNVAAGYRAAQEAATNLHREHPVATTAGLMAVGGAAYGSALGPAGAAVGAAVGAGFGAALEISRKYGNPK